MLLDKNYDYITKFECGSFKLELYDTGKRSFFFLKPVYAYQLFEDNRLIHEDHNVKSNKPEVLLGAALKTLDHKELKQIDYVEEFLPV